MSFWFTPRCGQGGWSGSEGISSVIAWMQHQLVKDSYTVKLYLIGILEFGYRTLNLNDPRFFGASLHTIWKMQKASQLGNHLYFTFNYQSILMNF